MNNNVLLALIAKMIDDKLAELPRPVVGPRGFRGTTGEPGRDFIFSEHEEKIRSWVKDFSLKFEDLSDEEIGQLRGPRGFDGVTGRDGKDGRDGEDFSFSKHEPEISAIINSAVDSMSDRLKLKFTDLTEEEIRSLRGPRGKDGKAGESFSFAKNEAAIRRVIQNLVDSMSDNLKLKFSDLTEDELFQLRGPRGRDGKDGKNFVFDDHLEFFKSLKLKFSDLTSEEIESLKLKFKDLSPDDVQALKLRFDDLTPEDKFSLKGPRGQRGRQGQEGEKGTDGRDGIRGLPGPCGPRGLTGEHGLRGFSGVDGVDAPFITTIDVEQHKDYYILVFHFSDGSEIRTNKVHLPQRDFVFVGGGGNGSSTTVVVPPDPGGGGDVFTGPVGEFDFANDTLDQDIPDLIFDPELYRSAKVEWTVFRKSTGGGGQIRTQTGAFYIDNNDGQMVLTDLPMSGTLAGVSLDVTAGTGQVFLDADDNGGTQEVNEITFETLNLVPIEDDTEDDYMVSTILNDTLAQEIPGLKFGGMATRSAKVEWEVYRKSTGGGGQTRMQSGAFYVTNDGTEFALTVLGGSSPPAGVTITIDDVTGEVIISSDDNGGVFHPDTSVFSYRTVRMVDFNGDLHVGPQGGFIFENNTPDQIVEGLSFGLDSSSTYIVEWTAYRKSTGGGGQSRIQSGSFYALYNGIDWQLSAGPFSAPAGVDDLYIDSVTGQVSIDTDDNGGTYQADDSIFVYRLIN